MYSNRFTAGPRAAAWRRCALGLVAALALGIAACGGDDESSQEQAAASEQSTQKVGIQLDFLYAGYQAPFFLAEERGYWADKGLDVTIRQGNGSANGIKTLLGGLNEVGLFDRPTMAVSADRTDDLIAIMGVDNKGGWAVATPADKGVTEPQQLEGLRIATQIGGADGTLLPAFFEKNSLSPDDVTVESVDPAAKTTLLQAGKVDGATYINYAQVPQVEASGLKLNTMLWSDHGLPIIGAGLVASRKWVDEQPDAARAFVAGTVQGFEEAKKDPEAAIDAFLAATKAKLDRKVALEQLDLILEAIETPETEGQPLGYQAPESWSTTLSTLKDAGMVKNAREPDFYFSNEYLPTG